MGEQLFKKNVYDVLPSPGPKCILVSTTIWARNLRTRIQGKTQSDGDKGRFLIYFLSPGFLRTRAIFRLAASHTPDSCRPAAASAVKKHFRRPAR